MLSIFEQSGAVTLTKPIGFPAKPIRFVIARSEATRQSLRYRRGMPERQKQHASAKGEAPVRLRAGFQMCNTLF